MQAGQSSPEARRLSASTGPELLQGYEDENKRQRCEDGFTTERYAQLCRHFPGRCSTVLDVGCSTGLGGLVIARRHPGASIIGLDCVADRLAALPACYSSSVRGLSTDIPLDDRSVDVVVAGEFLEHLRPHDVDHTLCEFQRVLRVGGRLLLTTPNPGYLKNRVRGLSVYSVAHLTQHESEVLRLRLRAHGFARIRIRGSGRVSRYVGSRFPVRAVYGSYLVVGDKR
jgi:ubiquinone/menaquinone biosynthesis C-methylase UbiE